MDANTKYKLAINAFNDSDYTSAKDSILELLDAGINSSEIQNLLALSYSNLGEKKLSIAAIEQSINLAPEDLEKKYNQGKIFQDFNDYGSAIDIYLEILKSNAEHFKSILNIAICFEKVSNYAQALKYYQQALKIKPNNIELLRTIAWNCNLLNDNISAELYYKKILELDPDNKAAKYDLTIMHFKQKVITCRENAVKYFAEPIASVHSIDREQILVDCENPFELIASAASLLSANLPYSSTYYCDNMLTFSKTLGFLHDKHYAELFTNNSDRSSVLWRTYVLCWAAKQVIELEGDLMELGCNNGSTAKVLAEHLNLDNTNKKLFIYDVFYNPPDSHKMLEHSASLFENVKQRLAKFSSIIVTKGEVPNILNHVCPDKVCFAHIDMNSVKAEIGALDKIYNNITKGGIIIFDDYGWFGYKAQYDAEKKYMETRGQEILELPTGQGLLIKK